MGYDWNTVFIPLHPLIAEARRHAARTMIHMSPDGVSSTTKWPSALGQVDLSQLNCLEADRVALRNYFEYLEMWAPR